MPNESIDHIHIVYVRQRPSWHLTAIAYDSNGHPVADCSFVVNRLLWKSVEEKLKKGLGI